MWATPLDPQKLRKLLTERGMTVRQLSELTGIRTNTLYCYLSGKRGRRPSYKVLEALKMALQLDSVEEVLSEDVTNEAHKEKEYVGKH